MLAVTGYHLRNLETRYVVVLTTGGAYESCMKQCLHTIVKQHFTTRTLERYENHNFGKPFAIPSFTIRKVVISDVTGLPVLSDVIKSFVSFIAEQKVKEQNNY
jgi:hypothetical protein